MRSPCHIRMYKTNINIFHNKYLSKAAKILQWQFFWSICDTSFNLHPYANYTACCLLCQRWDHCDQHLVTPDRRLARLPPRWWKTWWCSSAICDCWETHLLCLCLFNIYVLTSANQFWFEKTTFGLPASGSGSQMSSESYSSSFGLCVSVFLFFCLFACLS